ncbi:TPA: hypothetical protein JLU00_000243 [Escherichia coli]|nr:hypothetical protein [Escherichia coli]
MKELELKKPIIAHGETLSVLEFDEPTGKDVRELGYLDALEMVDTSGAPDIEWPTPPAVQAR